MTSDGIVKVINALPTSKLIDTVLSVLGKAFEPRHIKKMADARAYEINTISEALRNNSDVIIAYEKGSVIANTPEFEDFVKRAEHRLAYQELQKQYNIESVIGNAYIELEKEENVSEDPVDKDWINSFFDSVANVSNEQMQIIWGKILSGEIKKPGTFSIRTLDTLKKMTQKEALLFKKYAPYILQCMGNREKTFNDYFLLCDIVGSFEEMVFPEILILHEAGLISLNGISIMIFLEPNSTEYINGLSYNIAFNNTGSNNVEISERAFLLTESAKELYNVMLSIGIDVPTKEYYDKCLDVINVESILYAKKWKNQVDSMIVAKQI